MKRKSRVYILPTAFGYLFISGALVMMLIGATYQNNLVNLLAFFMMSLVFISMVQTHNNLKDVELQKLVGENSFAHGEYVMGFVLGNPSKETRHALEVDLKKLQPHLVLDNNLPLLAGGQLKLKISYRAGERGKLIFKRAKVHTAYPLGLFRAWIWLEGETSVFIYPEPKKLRPAPTTNASEARAIPQSQKGGDDFHGHRRYHVGDPFGHIDWKAHARGRPLLVKEFNDGAPNPHIFDWRKLDGLSIEEKLSTLSYWIGDAAKKNLVFGIKMPGVTIAPAQGSQHVQRCLELLAVFKQEDEEEVRDVRSA